MAKLSDLLRDERSGGTEPLEKGVSRFLSEIGAELKHQAEAGAHELSAALLRGHDGFVMYQRDGVEDAQSVEAPKTPEIGSGGMER